MDEGVDWTPRVSSLPSLPEPVGLPEAESKRVAAQATYITGLLQTLSALMELQLGQPVPMPVNQIIALLRRILVLDVDVLRTSVLQHRQLLVQAQLLRLLDAGWQCLDHLVRAVSPAILAPHASTFLSLASAGLQAHARRLSLRASIYATVRSCCGRLAGLGYAHAAGMATIIRHALSDAASVVEVKADLLTAAGVNQLLQNGAGAAGGRRWRKPAGGLAASGAMAAALGFDLNRPRRRHEVALPALEGKSVEGSGSSHQTPRTIYVSFPHAHTFMLFFRTQSSRLL